MFYDVALTVLIQHIHVSTYSNENSNIVQCGTMFL